VWGASGVVKGVMKSLHREIDTPATPPITQKNAE
jgi:hypothetical protein